MTTRSAACTHFVGSKGLCHSVVWDTQVVCYCECKDTSLGGHEGCGGLNANANRG